MATQPEDGKKKERVPAERTFGRGLAAESSASTSPIMWWVFAGCSVLIVLAILGWFYYEDLTATRAERNEAAAIVTLRELNRAIETFAEQHGRAPASLAELGPAAEGAGGGVVAAGLIDAELAGGTRGGYRFRYQARDTDEDGKPDSYRIHADPVTPGTTGNRWFFTDTTGIVRFSLDGPASEANAPIS